MAQLQYVTKVPNSYIVPSDTAGIEGLGGLGLQTIGTQNGIQKLLAVQQLQGAAPARANAQSGLFAQKVVLTQPQRFANGATTYAVQQPAVQQRAQQLAPGTQIISAFNAEGQPVTLAINPNGGTSVLPQQFTIAGGQPVASQQVQLRQVPATAVLQGQRQIQLGHEVQAVQAGPTMYKVMQQPNTAVQQGERFILQTAQGQQVVQRIVPAANAVQLKQATSVQPVQIRPAGSVGTVVPGIQMGRSLIHMPARPNGTVVQAFPNTAGNVVSVGKVPVSKPVIKPLQQVQHLPSSILVKPADAGAAVVNGSNVVPAQSLQQQVKDTAAQQRQQQLLASLRARVASLQEVQGVGAPFAGLNQANGLAGGTQLRRLINVGDAGGALQLQSDDATADQLNLLAGAANGLVTNGRTQLDAQTLMSLTGLVQQGQLSGQALGKILAGEGQDMGQGGIDADSLARLLQDSNSALLAATQADKSQALREQFGLLPGQNGAGLPSGRMLMMPGAPGGVLGSGGSDNGSLNSSMDGKLPHQPASPDAGGKEDLRAILYSIGFELARHGIDVQTAVDAGLLGVLNPSDVAVLQEAYNLEECRLAVKASEGQGTMPKPTGLSASVGAPSIGSRGSPAHSIASAPGGGATTHDPVWTPPASAPPPQITEIDDSHFSAFAYDFFGGADNGGLGVGDLFEALEAENSLGNKNSQANESNASGGVSRHSSVATSAVADMAAVAARALPTRAPSWPPGNKEASTDGAIQTENQSIASFSDTCAVNQLAAGSPNVSNGNGDSGDAVSTASSSNHELVARIANLDLGCGFY